MENQLHVKMAVAHTAFRGPVMSASAMCGLLPGQPKVLEYLAVHPGCQRKEIAAAWNADKSTLSGFIARMERDGLLVSSENAADKRGKLSA